MTTKTKTEVTKAVQAIVGSSEPLVTLRDVQREVARMIQASERVATYMGAMAGTED